MVKEVKKEATKAILVDRVRDKWNKEQEILKQIQEKQTLTVNIKEVGTLVNHVFESIMELTEEHGRVQLPGFGSFNKVRREIRKGRNPQTGEQVIIPAKNTVTVKPSDNFKNNYIKQ